MKTQKIQYIFIQCPNWVGDFIMSTPSIRSLRVKYPEAHITLCMRPLLKPLIEGSNWYNEIILYDKKKEHKGIKGWIKLIRRVQKNKYDLAVIFPNSIRSGLISFFTRAKKRIGYERFAQKIFLTNYCKRPRENGQKIPIYTGEYYSNLMKLIDSEPQSLYPELPLLDKTQMETSEIWKKAIKNPNGIKIVMTPGASFGSSKLWPARHWAKLIDLIWEKYRANIIMAPGPGEESFTEKIKELATQSFFIQPPSFSGLTLLKGFIAQANIVICNDTGPRHIAHAFRIPSVVMMGPTDPRHTFTPLENAIVVRNEVSCSPCHLKLCPYAHHACMEELLPQKILMNIEKILQKKEDKSL